MNTEKVDYKNNKEERMDLQQLIGMAQQQQQGGGQPPQGQPMGLGQPQQGGMPPQGMMGGQPQVNPQQAMQMKIQQTWQKMNTGGNVRGIPMPIFKELPPPTQKSVLSAPPQKLMIVYEGLSKDESYINAKHSNDIPAQQKRITAYLKTFNLYNDVEPNADNVGQV